MFTPQPIHMTDLSKFTLHTIYKHYLSKIRASRHMSLHTARDIIDLTHYLFSLTKMATVVTLASPLGALLVGETLKVGFIPRM